VWGKKRDYGPHRQGHLTNEEEKRLLLMGRRARASDSLERGAKEKGMEPGSLIESLISSLMFNTGDSESGSAKRESASRRGLGPGRRPCGKSFSAQGKTSQGQNSDSGRDAR